MNYIGKIKLKFYEQKWFKLLCLFAFFCWLTYYVVQEPFEIDKNKLIELTVTVDKEWKSGGKQNPVKIYFKTKEYSNQFGIYVGGTFGRWTEVTETLEHNRRIIIKIHKNNKEKLNNETKLVPIYFLSSDKSGLIFNENDFNEGEKSSDNRFKGLFLIIFLYCLWKILIE